MNRTGLLLRMDPDKWKKSSHLGRTVWFKAPRSGHDQLVEGMPVFMLGTKGTGILGVGRSMSGVVVCPDPESQEMRDDLQGEYASPAPRFQVHLDTATVSLEVVNQVDELCQLYRRREAATWLTELQVNALFGLLRLENAESSGG